MPNEQQELQLRVTLDDQASAQLQQIRQALASIGVTAGGGPMARVTSHVSEFDKALGALGRTALGVGKTAVDLAKTIGPLPVALGTLAYQLNRSTEATKAWGDQLVATSNAARMAGISVGDFKGIISGMRAQGVSAESASAMIQRFTQAYGQLMLQGSQRRQQLVQLAGPEFANNMMNAIRHIGALRTDTEKLNYIRQMGENVYRNELAKSGDAQLAAFKRDSLFDILEVRELAALRHNISEYDDTTKENMKAEAESMEALRERQTEEEEIRNRIGDILRGSIASQETWITNQIVFVESKLLKWMETESERIRKKGFWYNFFYLPGMADPNDQNSPQSDRDATEGLQKNRPFLEGGFDPGGGGSAPFDLNNLLGGGSAAVEKTDENTSELTRLSRNIMRLWNDPKALLLRGNAVIVPGYAKGGTVNKSTLAMVGESGPELVTGVSGGSTVVSKPSVGVLPSGAKVVPFKPDRNITGDTMLTGESRTGKASFYGNYQGAYNWIDKGDIDRRTGRPLPGYTGTPLDVPGVAVPSQVTSGPAGAQRGEYFAVTTPEGQTYYGPQVDIGPNKRTGRILDINAPMAERMGYVPDEVKGGKHFPTDSPFTVRHVDPEEALWMGQPFDSDTVGGIGKEKLATDMAMAFGRASGGGGGEGTQVASADSGGDNGDRSTLDRMMGNQIMKVGMSGNIKIKHENAPPGTTVEAGGGILDNAETETSRTFDVAPSARWRHPDAGEKERRKEIDSQPYQPIDYVGIRG
jgi:hypothetical protein